MFRLFCRCIVSCIMKVLFCCDRHVFTTTFRTWLNIGTSTCLTPSTSIIFMARRRREKKVFLHQNMPYFNLSIIYPRFECYPHFLLQMVLKSNLKHNFRRIQISELFFIIRCLINCSEHFVSYLQMI